MQLRLTYSCGILVSHRKECHMLGLIHKLLCHLLDSIYTVGITFFWRGLCYFAGSNFFSDTPVIFSINNSASKCSIITGGLPVVNGQTTSELSIY